MKNRILFTIVCLMCVGSVRPVSAADLEVVEHGAPLPDSAQRDTPPPDQAKETKQPQAQLAPLIVRAEEPGAPLSRAPLKKLMPPPQETGPQGTGEPTRYTLGPDDVIEINVRRHPEFSNTYSVNAEGKIQYKFVGDVEIKGLTKTEVKEKIAKILNKYILSPEVDVTIVEYRSKIIYVIGEVGAPGKYYMRADKISLREAMVQAGLPTLSASMRRTQLIRPDKSGKPFTKTIDIYALLYEGKLNLDIDMLPGDVLVVPATLFAKIARIINPIAGPVATSDTLRRAGTGGI